MGIDIQYRINENPLEKKYLRENSYWYKYLNRSSSYYPKFIEEMKKQYKLTSEDRLNNLIANINLIKTLLDELV